MAVIQPVAGTGLDIDELIEFCRPQMPYFAIPRYVDVVEALPTTENEKIRKSVLREQGVTPTTVDLQPPRPPAAEGKDRTTEPTLAP